MRRCPRARLVDDAPQRDRVGRVVERLQVRHRVLDLGALVEARAADHLVGHAVAHEQVLEHARLRVRAVEDRDLARGDALLEQPADARGDEARLGLLVLHLDHADRLAVAEIGPEPLLETVRVVRDDGVGGVEDRAASSGSSARGGSPRRRRSRARSRGCCGCRRRGTRTPTGRSRRPRTGSDGARRAASRCGTARGSCPGTRRSAGA